MPGFLFYGLSILSGFAYAIAALGLKSAMRLGVGPLRVVFMSNWMSAIVFSPLLLFSEFPSEFLSELWMPILTGFCAFLGQIFVSLAIRIGDVTIQAPLMGMKIILVALMTIALGLNTIDTSIWVSIVISSLAVFILGASGFKNRRAVLLTSLFAFLACTFFAAQDVLIQKFASDFGPLPFLVLMTSALPFFALTLIPFFRAPFSSISRHALKWLVFGTGMNAIQALLFTLPIALRGEAAIVNILYSARGLWSILIVWLIGHLFNNEEIKQQSKFVLIQRIVGSVLLSSAVFIVLMD